MFDHRYLQGHSHSSELEETLKNCHEGPENDMSMPKFMYECWELQYDLSVTTFSPDGRVFQVEYASKAVDNSGYATYCIYRLLCFPSFDLIPN